MAIDVAKTLRAKGVHVADDFDCIERTAVRSALAQLFEAQVARTPDALAVKFNGGALSYSELNLQADQLARRFVARGLGSERVAAVALKRSPGLVVAFLAVIKAGGIYMPVDSQLPPKRLEFMLDDAEPQIVVAQTETLACIPNALKTLVVNVREDAVSGQDGVQCARERTVTDRTSPAATDLPLYLLYTSGSSGRPKGVLMGTDAIVNMVDWYFGYLPRKPRVTALFAAIGFDAAILEMLSSLLSGGTLAVPPEECRLDPARLVDWLDRNDVTDLMAPMTVVSAFCRAAVETGRSLPALTHILQGGEVLVLEKTFVEFCMLAPDRLVTNGYGPTETHGLSAHLLDGPPSEWPERVPVGSATSNVRLYVLNADLQPVPVGAEGELYAAGACLARGYFKDPVRTAERFIPDPFGRGGERLYRTGDLMRWRPDGLLEYIGRADSQIKIRGVRVELGEVESSIRRIEGVRDVALIVAGEGHGRHLSAYLIPERTAVDLAERVCEELRAELPREMIPASFTLVDAFPTNANGKIDRSALPLPAVSDLTTETPATEQEAVLCRLFAEAVGLAGVGTHDDLFQLGCHSLALAWLVSRIRAELRIDVTLVDVVANPTVAQLAQAVEHVGAPSADLGAIARPERVPASFAQQRLWILDQLDGPSAAYNVPLVFSCSERLDADALRRALTDVVAKHESLRTLLVAADGMPYQLIVHPDDAQPVLEEVELPPESFDEALLKSASHPFDLAEDLPIRGVLFSTTCGQHVLLLVIHHYAYDGGSFGPLTRDLATAYSTRASGHTPHLDPLPVQYADLTLWHYERVGDNASPTDFGRKLRKFWADAMHGAPSAVALPGRRSRPRTRSGRGNAVHWAVEPEQHLRVSNLASESNCTVFMVVHAVIAVLLNQSSVGGDIVIGAAASNRDETLTGDLVGLCVNTIPLRVNLSGCQTFQEVLRVVHAADTAAYAHQDLPFDQIVDVVKAERSTAYLPLVQVMLAFQVEDPRAPRFGPVELEQLSLDLGVAKFDLTFDAVQKFAPDGSPSGMAGHLEFATDVIDVEAGEEILREFLALLYWLTAHPNEVIETFRS